MFSVPVREVMSREPLLLATPHSTVSEAARRMADGKASAIVVIDHSAVVGIFTGRDAVTRVLAAGSDPQTTCLAAVMTAAPLTTAPDSSFGHALNVMQTHGIRHLPVLENGIAVGMVSSRNALDPELEEFVSETHRREGFR